MSASFPRLMARVALLAALVATAVISYRTDSRSFICPFNSY